MPFPRSVTFIPTGIPCLNLKLDTLTLALTTTGACPASEAISFRNSSMPFLSISAPKELLMTTFLEPDGHFHTPEISLRQELLSQDRLSSIRGHS